MTGRFLLQLLFAVVIALTLPMAKAQASADVRQVTMTPSGDGLALTGTFALTLSSALTDAVNHGIPLVFQMQVQVRRPRWYWVDDAVFSGHADRRLTYNALVRNYRVTEGQDGRNFVNLQDALDYVARPVTWTLSNGRVRAGESLEIQLRFRLDPAFLPKPFQVVSFGDRDWRLDSDWRTFRLTAPVAQVNR
jgi:Domain of unknown function (DUF4390)